MRGTLDACISAAHAIIFKHGDVYMFPDPYVFKALPATGLELQAHSTMVPGLKWTDLVNTLLGLTQVMWHRALYREAHVKMYDQPSGIEMGVVDLYESSAIKPAFVGDIT